jgi:hypothetical protein
MLNQMIKNHTPDSGILTVIKKVPPHFLFGAMLFALLWLMSEYFVTRKEYDKDQNRIEKKLDDVAGDIKEILRKAH